MSVFLTISDDRVIYRGDFFFMIYDAYPVSKNHLLIISNELREDYFSLTEEEQQEGVGQPSAEDNPRRGSRCGEATTERPEGRPAPARYGEPRLPRTS